MGGPPVTACQTAAREFYSRNIAFAAAFLYKSSSTGDSSFAISVLPLLFSQMANNREILFFCEIGSNFLWV